MNRFLIFLFTATVMAGVCSGDGFTSRIDTLKNGFDAQGLQFEYDLIKNSTPRSALADYRSGKAASFLVEVRDALNGETSDTEKIALAAIAWCEKGLSAESLSLEETTDTYYILAQMYDRLIRDAVSWITYNAHQEKYLQLCLILNPEHKEAKLLYANKLLNLPESAGGNPVKGRALLLSLQEAHPDDIPIKLALVQDLLDRKDLPQAKAMLSEVIGLNPDHIIAFRLGEEIAVMEEEPTIRTLTLFDQLKTSESRVLHKLSPFLGRPYTFETKNALTERLEQIRSIVGSVITAREGGIGEVDLIIKINENNMIMLGAMGVFELSRDYDGQILPRGFPVLLYTDQNFLGTAARTMLIFAGPYINFDYDFPGLIDDRYLDIRFNWESLFLETDAAPVQDGRVQTDMLVKSPLHSVSLGVGQKFPAGLSIFMDTKISCESWAPEPGETAPDLTVPSYHLKYQPSLELSFSTMREGTGSQLEAPRGFYFQMVPSLLFIPHYSAWGKPGELITHNARPQWKFIASSGYARPLFPGHSLIVAAEYMTGGNMYSLNRWKTGKSSPTSSGVSLDGYYQGEFTFDQGVLGNITYHFEALPSKVSVFGRYAVFYNHDTREVYHGSAFGIVGKLPFDMELTSRLGIGFNAGRESGMGYEVDFVLSRVWFF